MAGRNALNTMTSDIFSRFDWGAMPPKRTESMKQTPVTRVVSVMTDVDPCTTVDECKQRVREIQKRHMMEQNMDDIQHHFLIGGDGNIYEGRGWHNIGPTYPPHMKYADELTGNSIEIGFIGRSGETPSENITKAASDCMAFGLVSRCLQEKVLFFWKTPGRIEFLSFYETNSPGQSSKANFTDHDISKYTKAENKEETRETHENAGFKSSTTDKSNSESSTTDSSEEKTPT